MTKLFLSLIFFSFVSSTSNWAAVNCPAGSKIVQSCSILPFDGAPHIGVEVLVLCKQQKNVELIFDDIFNSGESSFREVVTLTPPDADLPGCKGYTNVSGDRKAAFCNVEKQVFGYLNFDGAGMSLVLTCK